MNYMHGLIMMMDPADFTNSSDTRLAVSRIITWTTEPKSVDVRKVTIVTELLKFIHIGRNNTQKSTWLAICLELIQIE